MIFFLGLKLGHTLDTNLWGVGVWDSCLRNQQLKFPLSSIFFSLDRPQYCFNLSHSGAVYTVYVPVIQCVLLKRCIVSAIL